MTGSQDAAFTKTESTWSLQFSSGISVRQAEALNKQNKKASKKNPQKILQILNWDESLSVKNWILEDSGRKV